MRLLPQAVPAARTAAGTSVIAASSSYVRVSPGWNGSQCFPDFPLKDRAADIQRHFRLACIDGTDYFRSMLADFALLKFRPGKFIGEPLPSASKSGPKLTAQTPLSVAAIRPCPSGDCEEAVSDAFARR